MPVPQSKPELLHAIEQSYEKLARDLAQVPEARAREKSMPGHKQGTVMSPADLVAYLIGWNETVLSWHKLRGQSIEPEFPAPGFNWNQLGELAQHFYDTYEDLSWPELLTRFEAAESQIVALVSKLTNEELYGAPWYGKYTAGRMIQFNTSSPYANARTRVRAYLRASRGS